MSEGTWDTELGISRIKPKWILVKTNSFCYMDSAFPWHQNINLFIQCVYGFPSHYCLQSSWEEAYELYSHTNAWSKRTKCMRVHHRIPYLEWGIRWSISEEGMLQLSSEEWIHFEYHILSSVLKQFFLPFFYRNIEISKKDMINYQRRDD